MIRLSRALRPVWSEYRAGGSLSGWNFVGGTAATRRTRLGRQELVAIAANSGVRTNWRKDPVTGLLTPVTALEGSRTQLVIDPENMGSANWNLINSPIRTGGQSDPFGGVNAWNVEDNDAVLSEGINGACSAFTGDGVKSLACFMRGVTTNVWSRFALRDNVAAVDRAAIELLWPGSIYETPSVAGVVGTQLDLVAYDDGWWLAVLESTAVTAANAHLVHCRGSALLPAQVGTYRFFGANVWNTRTPGSYQGPTIPARLAQSLTRPWPHKPQAMWIYLKYYDRGSFNEPDERLFTIGGPTFTAPYLSLQYSTTNGYRLIYDGGTFRSSVFVPSAFGQMMELLCILYPDGSVQAVKSINGAAEIRSTRSGVGPIPSNWNGTPPTLFLNGGNGATVTNMFIELLHMKAGPYEPAGPILTVDQARAA